jgi:hypothetical protein
MGLLKQKIRPVEGNWYGRYTYRQTNTQTYIMTNVHDIQTDKYTDR